MYEQLSRVPPESQVSFEAVQPLSLTQRLNRLRFCCYYLTGAIIAGLSAALLFIFSRATWTPEGLAPLLLAAIAGLGLAFFVWSIGLMVRRLHDRDHAGWWALLALVPVVNLLFSIYLLVAPGTAGGNRFGAPNPPNGLLVQIFGGVWWLLSMVSMAANIIMMFVMPEVFLQSWSQWPQSFQGSGSLMESMPGD